MFSLCLAQVTRPHLNTVQYFEHSPWILYSFINYEIMKLIAVNHLVLLRFLTGNACKPILLSISLVWVSTMTFSMSTLDYSGTKSSLLSLSYYYKKYRCELLPPAISKRYLWLVRGRFSSSDGWWNQQFYFWVSLRGQLPRRIISFYSRGNLHLIWKSISRSKL